MPNDWKLRQLKDCAVWYSGGTPSKANADFWGGTIPWISAKSLKNFYVSNSEEKVTERAIGNGTRLVPKDTILFIVRGMSLKNEFRMGITKRPVSFNQDLKALAPVSDVWPDFLAYAIRAKTKEILGFVGEAGHGTGVLPTDRIQSLLIPLPAMEEQKGIAKIFRSLDDKIELNQKTNETLEAISHTLFKSWFVDFDPVIDNALNAGNKIPEELIGRATQREALGDLRKPLPEEIRVLFPNEFELTEKMGWLPKGWTINPFSALATLMTDSVNTRSCPDIVFEHYSIPAFDEGMLPSLDLGEEIKSNKYKVFASSILSSKLNPHVPRTWLPNVESSEVAVCSTEFMNFVPKTKEWRPYVYCQVTSEYFQNGIRTRVTGTTGSRQRAKPNEVAVLPVILPCRKLINIFAEFTHPFFDKILANRKEIDSLSMVRDALLPKLCSGELRIPEVEDLAESAA